MLPTTALPLSSKAVQVDVEMESKIIQVDVQVEDKAVQAGTVSQEQAVQTETSIHTSSALMTGVGSCVELQDLSLKYASLCHDHFGVSVPNDFLVYSGAAMVHLATNRRSNVLYNLAKGLGTLRKDGKDTLFPIRRMPMGLVEYAANFYVAENVNQVME